MSEWNLPKTEAYYLAKTHTSSVLKAKWVVSADISSKSYQPCFDSLAKVESQQHKNNNIWEWLNSSLSFSFLVCHNLSPKKTPNAPMHVHNYSGSQSSETKKKKPGEKGDYPIFLRNLNTYL